MLEGKSDTKAYEDAGYKTDRHHAARLATKGHIQGRLAFLHSEAAKEAVIDCAWVIKRLVENVGRAMQAVEITDAEGNRTGVYTYQGSVANKALELLGRNIPGFLQNRSRRRR